MRNEEKKMKQKDLMKRKKEQGICRSCASQAVPGRALCEKHLIAQRDAKRKYARELRELRTASILRECPHCGEDIAAE